MVYFKISDDDGDFDHEDGNVFIGAIYKRANGFFKYGMDITRTARPLVTIYPLRLRYAVGSWIDVEVSV